MRIQVSEYLCLDLVRRQWCCQRCEHDLGPAQESYKRGCLVRDRDPREVHYPQGTDPEFNFSFDPRWIRLLEFYCPGCATLLETEYLPPGHPLTWDVDLDVDALRAKHGIGDAVGGDGDDRGDGIRGTAPSGP